MEEDMLGKIFILNIYKYDQTPRYIRKQNLGS